MPKNIEAALNLAAELKLKLLAETSNLSAAIAAYERQHKIAYNLLKKWIRSV